MSHGRQRPVTLSSEPLVVLLDEAAPEGNGGPSTPSAVTIAIVPDPAKLLDERSPRIHGDVLDALVDLVVELIDKDAVDGSGSSC